MTNDDNSMLPTEGFLRLPAVLRVFPVGKSTWWAGVKSGRFPKPVKLGINTTAWRAEDIRALIARSEKSLLASTYVERLKRKHHDEGMPRRQRWQDQRGR